MKNYDGIALFSGGLDSILAARLVMEQGLKVKCLHFFSPFFGHPGRIAHWQKEYGLDIDPIDVSPEFVELLKRGPAHGFGSAMNPCVDCKIVMISRARELMQEYGAKFIVSGEVLGQRPMSQRRDTLNAIRANGGRIICVGTTSVRTLETVATEDGVIHPGAGDTAIFIYPGKKIKAVDALITNFHLPQSTLLMLVSTFMGRETALDVYREAVEEKYRFFSFGDAMFIE